MAAPHRITHGQQDVSALSSRRRATSAKTATQTQSAPEARSDRVIPAMNQVFVGDSIETMKNWESGVFHACITDPPYNIAANRKGLGWAFSSHVTLNEDWDRFTSDDYLSFTRAWLTEVCRLVKPNGNIFIFGSYHNIYTMGAVAQAMQLRVVNSIIWAKPNAQPNITCRMFTESTEQILWLCNNTEDKAKNWTFNYQHMKEMNGGKQMRNYWEIPLTPRRERVHGKHPSQKPLALLERLILAGTNPGDRVLDCFLGSGTTAVAAELHKRSWVGIERDPSYSDLAMSRVRNMREQKQLPSK